MDSVVISHMEPRQLGRTGWSVNPLAIGTVELGITYGIHPAGQSSLPSETDAIDLLLRAFERGVNFLDTAPAYGRSERVVGQALREWHGTVYVATKVARPEASVTFSDVRRTVFASLDASLSALRRDYADVVQIHNAVAQDFEDGIMIETLMEARAQGKIRQIGATVYDVADAMAAIRHGECTVLQVPYNLMDQRMAEVFPVAAKCGVAIVTRSALLKGVLSERRKDLPASLSCLREPADRVQVWAAVQGLSLVEAALLYCLSAEHVSAVLVGIVNAQELETALSIAAKAPLSLPVRMTAAGLGMADELVDPRRWGIP